MSAAISPIGVALIAPSVAALAESVNSASGFADAFGKLIDSTNAKINSANLEVQKLAVGKAESLHGVMISIESAKESLNMVVQIRNRLLDAYQDILKMQI
ncbi:flagellar hook-basal body complex protein FliE [Nevskia soli]|uniref:flagellar hook-basal body complex protein FliE n=1 Tax=Nevskia soli TaxID=418856 RepID=UPI000689E50F|nr:flagellar hook-basal body complex protein FliE [Nevskia soli]